MNISMNTSNIGFPIEEMDFLEQSILTIAVSCSLLVIKKLTEEND